MFASAQRLIFGEDRNVAKLQFHSNLLPRLSEEQVGPEDSSWAQFWLVFDSAADVATLLPIVSIRSILVSHPENIATLIRILCGHLFALVQDPDFPNAPLPPSSPYLSSGATGFLGRRRSSAGTTPRAPDLAREALNCVRVLSRLFPCIFERAGLGPPASGSLIRDPDLPPETAKDELALEPDRFEEELLWTKEKRRKVLQSQHSGNDGQFVIAEEDEDDTTARIPSIDSEEWIELPPLGERLLGLVVDMLFVAGFTLPEEVSKEHDDGRRIAYVIWEAGIGATASLNSTVEQEAHRAEVLRLLLVLLSRSMYVPPSSTLEEPHGINGESASTSAAPSSGDIASNRFLQSLRKWPVRRVALSLLCSLLNTAVATASSLASPTAVQSLSNAAASVPLVGSVIGGRMPNTLSGPVAGLLGRTASDTRKQLGWLSLCVLDILITDLTSSDNNIFRHYLSKLHRQADFRFITTGLVDMIAAAAEANALGAEQSGSRDSAPSVMEGLVLFWRLLDCNPKMFAAALQELQTPPKLLCSLLLICLEQKDEPSALGLIRLCTFLLQTLTSERAFGAQLNITTDQAGVRGAVRGKWAQAGTIADFLVVSIYHLVFTTKGALSSLYTSFTGILVNCSPYIKRLSVVASTRLLQLFLAFSAPVFLLAEDDNPRLCYNLLELFNNVIHHQLSDNPNLIYAMIRSHHRFEELASFTLSGAVADIRKARAEREAGMLNKNSSSTSLNATPLPSPTLLEQAEDAFPRRSEKARGKMRESAAGDRDEGDPGFPGAYTSRTGFTPTAAWVSSWREALPLDSILVMLSELKPKVESLCSVASPSTNQAVLDFLRSATLLGLLPAPLPLKARRFVPNPHAARWLLSIVWAAAYTRERAVFGGTRVALFSVQQATGGATTIDAVSEAFSNLANSVGSLQRRVSGGFPTPRQSLSMSQRRPMERSMSEGIV